MTLLIIMHKDSSYYKIAKLLNIMGYLLLNLRTKWEFFVFLQ